MKKFFSIFIFLLMTQTIFIPPSYASAPPIELNSSSVILYEANTSSVLYGLDEHTTKYPASVTKIATAIYAIENGNLNDIVTVSETARKAKGTRVYLEQGEQVTLEKLLYGLLINSGNDAATAIAEHISGTEEQFAKDMTLFFQNELKLDQTNFTNASGLFDENHYTTAYEMAKIVQYAMKNNTFMTVFNTPTYEWHGQSWETTLEAHHRIVNGQLPYDGITGGKNGYVPESRYTLATTAKRGDMHLIAIVFEGGKNTVYKDTTKLFDYGFEQFQLQSIAAYSNFDKDGVRYKNIQPVQFYLNKNTDYSYQIKNNKLHLLNAEKQLIKKVPLVMEEKPVYYANIQKSAIDPIPLFEQPTNKYTFGGLILLVLGSLFVFSRLK